VSRVFHDGVEDAVTGSAHCGLGPQKMDGQKDFKAYQASERGGEIDIEILGRHRILLSGYAVQTAKGTLHCM
jgi:predicted PhzF superfamily epimerase YddE/YHI9